MIDNQELIVPTQEKVWTSERRIQAFNTFSEAFKPILNTIYYPGSNIDISPSNTASFQGNKIIYVDTDKSAIQTLQRRGYDAHVENATVFDPGEVNLLLLLNFYAEQPLKYVVKAGYAICNGHWTGTVDKMLGQNDFKLVGVFTDENQTLETDEKTLRKNSQTSNPGKRNAETLFIFRKE